MKEKPQFDINSAFRLIKEKGGKEIPSFYRALFDQGSLSESDELIIGRKSLYKVVFFTEYGYAYYYKALHNHSEYLHSRVSKLYGKKQKEDYIVLKDVKGLPHRIETQVSLKIELPSLTHVSRILSIPYRGVSVCGIDLSACKNLQEIKEVPLAGFDYVTLPKECPLVKASFDSLSMNPKIYLV